MDRKDLITKSLLGSAITLALIAIGLSVTGTSARALSWVAPSGAGVALPTGASARSETVTLNGKRSTSRVCAHPTRSAESVLSFYASVAESEKAVGTPYLAMDNGQGGGSLIWVTPQGVRRGVVVEASPDGGSRWRIISEQGINPRAGQARPAPEAIRVDALPGGLNPALGLDVRFCMTRPDGTGNAVLEGPGGARDVAARLTSALEQAGFRPAQAEKQALLRAAPNTQHVILPFEHGSGALAGLLSVVPTPEGARASLSVRAAPR